MSTADRFLPGTHCGAGRLRAQHTFHYRNFMGQTCYTANTVMHSSQGPRWTGLSVPPCSGLGPEKVQG